jgi:hypothetical protein
VQVTGEGTRSILAHETQGRGIALSR